MRKSNRFSIAVCMLSATMIISGCVSVPNTLSTCSSECPEFPTVTESNLRPTVMAVGESVGVMVFARNPANYSGISISPGLYSFSIVGKPIDWNDGHLARGSDPLTGWKGPVRRLIGLLISPLKRFSGAPWYALVGEVRSRGSKVEFWVGDPMFEQRRITEHGELYFYANDMKGRYANNSGSLTLSVHRIE